jgi:parallel beta-helix repeat protein
MNKKIFAALLVFSFLIIANSVKATTDATGGTDSNDWFAGYPYASPITSSASGTLEIVGVNVYSGGTGNIRVAIYDDSSGTPNNLLCESGSTALSGAGWIDVDVSSCNLSITAFTNYWLAFQSDTSSDRFYVSTESAWQTAQSYGAFPDPFDGSSASSRPNMRMTYEAEAYINVSTCSILDQVGATYYLTADIVNSTNTTCMNITANNVTLDCQGYTIDGQYIEDTYGINIFRNSETNTNFTIENCVLSDWDKGIYLSSAQNNTIGNNTLNHNKYYGISLGWKAKSNLIIGNTITNNYGDGIYCGSYCRYNNITNNTISGGNYNGIRLSGGTCGDGNNIFYNVIKGNSQAGIYEEYDCKNSNIYNNFFNNTNNVVFYQLTLATNYWNTTYQSETNIWNSSLGYIGGNLWTTPTNNGFSDTCIDANYDGFCDSSYTLATDNVDYLPIAKATGQNIPIYINVSSCQNIVSSGEYRLNQSITQGSTTPCISIQANDVILDGQGYYIEDANPSVSNTIETIVHRRNITIKNINFYNLSTITANIRVFYNNSDIKILNNVITNFTGTGIIFDQPSGTNDTWINFSIISRDVVIDNNTVNRRIWSSSEVAFDPFGRWNTNVTTLTDKNGVNLNAVSNANFTNNKVINVTNSRGLSLDHSYNITINGNIIQGNSYGIWSHRNYFDGTDYAYKNIHIFNNSFLNNVLGMAVAERQRGFLIENNTFEQDGTQIYIYVTGIPIGNKKDTTIRNNIFRYGFDGGTGIYLREGGSNITIDNNTFINATVYGALGIRTRYNRIISDINFTNNIISSSDYEAKQTSIKYSATWLTGEVGYQLRVDADTNNTFQNVLSCNNVWNVENSSAVLPVVYRGVPTYRIHLYNVMNINSSSCSPYISIITPANINFGIVNVGSNYTVQNTTSVDTNLLDTKISMSSTGFTGPETFGGGNLTYYVNYTSIITTLKNPATVTMYRKNTIQTDYFDFRLSVPNVLAGNYTAIWTVTYAVNSQPIVDFIYDE